MSQDCRKSKTILQRTMQGARRIGRQKKQWEASIKERTGVSDGDFLRAGEDRDE